MEKTRKNNRQRGGKRKQLRPGKPYQDLDYLRKEYDIFVIIGHGTIDEMALSPVPPNTFIYNTARAGYKCGSVDEQLQLEMLSDADRTDEAADFFDEPNTKFPAIYEPNEYFPEHTYSFHNHWNPSMPNLIPLGVYKFPMISEFVKTWNNLRRTIYPMLSEANLGKQEARIKGLIPEWDGTFLSLAGNLLRNHDLSRDYTLSEIMAWPEMTPKGKGRIFVTWSCRSLNFNTIPAATAARIERVRRLSLEPPRTELNLATAKRNTFIANKLAFIQVSLKELEKYNIPPTSTPEELAEQLYQNRLAEYQATIAALGGAPIDAGAGAGAGVGAGATPLPSAPFLDPAGDIVPAPTVPASAPTKFTATNTEKGASRNLFTRRNRTKSLTEHAKKDPLFTRYKDKYHYGKFGLYPQPKKNTIVKTFYTTVIGIPEGNLTI